MAKETDKRWKGFLQDWNEVSDMDTVDYELKPLNQQQAAILLSAISVYRWQTRWTNLSIEKDELEKLISEIEYRLMINEECETVPIDCEEIEACLQTSPTIDQIEEIQSTGYNPANASQSVNTAKNSSVLSQDVYAPSSSCDDSDKDKLWSAINGLIDFWHNRNKQLLAEFSGMSSLQETVNALLSLQPIYAVLNSTIKNTFASWLLGQAKSAYENQVTTSVLYELKCELFCDAVDSGCNIDMQTAIETILAHGLSFSLSDNIVDLYTELSSLSPASAKEWFAAIGSLQAVLATLGEKSVSSVGLQAFLNAAEAGAANPSNSWKSYCDECSTILSWVAVFDFKGDYVSSDPDEIVFRAPFNLKLWGANSANEVNIVYGKGLVARHISGSAGTRRMIEFQELTNVQNVEYRGYMDTGNVNIFIESTSFAGWSIPASVADSGDRGSANNNTALLILFGNVTSGWQATIEHIKIKSNSNPAQYLPPPKQA